MTSESESFQYGPYAVEATALSKELFPKAGITKRDFIRYAEDISGFMLPHLKSRPLSFERYPDGVDAEGFFQKKHVWSSIRRHAATLAPRRDNRYVR